MDTRTTKEIEKDKANFRDLLIGLRRYIDEQLAQKITPHHALALYNEKLAIYKRLYN